MRRQKTYESVDPAPTRVDNVEILKLSDPFALLRHECAFVFGQMRDARAIPYLRKPVEIDPSPMVRHEAIEALGAIGDPEMRSFLEKIDNIDYLNDEKRF